MGEGAGVQQWAPQPRPPLCCSPCRCQAVSSDIPGSRSSTSWQKKARQKKTKQKILSDSQYFDTRESRGGAHGKTRLENILNSPLASDELFLHVTRLSPKAENWLYPMATSNVGWTVRTSGDGNSVDVKGTDSKGGRRENTALDNNIRD